MPGRFLEIPVFLGDCFIMPHPVHIHVRTELVDTIYPPHGGIMNMHQT